MIRIITFLIVFALLALLLAGCQLPNIAFDPAGKLAAKRTSPTATTASTPVLKVRATSSRTPTSTVTPACRALGDLNMRSAPWVGAPILDYFYTGDVVASSGESAGWRAVRNGAGVAGWASSKWLECGK